MAEYNDVIKHFKRMCHYYSRNKTQESCPMCASFPNCNIGQCRKIAFEQPAHFAVTIMRWAADHPEPVYPTWGEWLAEKGELCKNWKDIRVVSSAGNSRIGVIGWFYKDIPADMAEKLGIEPKEV